MANFNLKFLNVFILFTFLILLSSNLIKTKTAEEWKTRAIYQIITDRFSRTNPDDTTPCDLKANTYCGGTYRGLVRDLDYITNMGFNAIWISPIIKNTDNSFHGYHFTDLYSLNPNFGTEGDFIELITECHKRDVWVMIDVVANHCGPVGQNYELINPFNKPEYYHAQCQIQQDDWNNNQYNVEVYTFYFKINNFQNCRLADLPDLKQEHPFVRDTLNQWVKDIVAKYQLDGIRIDTVPEVPKWFWPDFVKSSNVFALGEVFNDRIDYVGDYQKYVTSLLNYPLYYYIQNAFKYQKSMKEITNINFKYVEYFTDKSILGNFASNHDNARFFNNFNDEYLENFINGIVFSLVYGN